MEKPSLCISVKLKNLKANHNDRQIHHANRYVVYIRKVKKSESKSQPILLMMFINMSCVYP